MSSTWPEIRAANATEWDARTEMEVGAFIRRYLLANPAPARTDVARDLEEWGVNLWRDGHARLGAAGIRPLSVAASSEVER